VSPLDPTRGSDTDKLNDNKQPNTKNIKNKGHEKVLLSAQHEDESLLQNHSDDLDIESRKIDKIDHFLSVSSHKEFSYIAKEYLIKNKYLIKNPDATAYDFLKAKQKIPTKYVIYKLFPYLALKFVNTDETKLEDSLAQVFRIAKSLNIEDLSKISFEDIVQIKNSLRNNFQQEQQQNIEHDTEIIDDADETTFDIIQVDNSDVYLDETDISYIQETTAGKSSTKDVLNRLKRSVLFKNRYKKVMILFSILFDSLMFFIIPAICYMHIYSIISLSILVLIPILYAVIPFCKNRIFVARANNYIKKNLDRGIEIVNSNKELSTEEVEIIKKLREHYTFLFNTIYFDEMHNLYSEIEKSQQQITLINSKDSKSLPNEIDTLKLQEKIKIKQQNIDEYLQLYESMYFLEIKELEHNTTQFEKVFLPKLNDIFSNMSEAEQQQSIDKVVDSKKLEKKINLISLFSVNTDVNELDNFKQKHTEQMNAKTIIKNSLQNVLSISKDLLIDRTASSLWYSVRVYLTDLIRHNQLHNVGDVIKAQFINFDVAIHGYYAFFFSLIMNNMEDKFSNYRHKKRMLDIKLGKPEKTGLFFGMVNPRLRTKREQVSTIMNNQKKNSIELYNLMKKHNKELKKDIKKLQKNKTISPEDMIRMFIDFQYYHLHSIMLANNSTTEFLQLMNIKIKELQDDFTANIEKN
jgi:hypothetical protein